jgi:hypothetical protein
VHALAQEGKLEYFDYHPEKEEDVVKFCAEIIKVSVLANTDIRNVLRGLTSATLVRRTTP